jgi:hypothetical protein
MSYTVNFDKVFEDEKGIYFEKRDSKHKLISTVRPEEVGYLKSMTMKIYIEKTVSNSEQLENEVTVFEQTLTVTIPEEKRCKYWYLFKTKNGSVYLKYFESGCCSQISVNDSELVKRSRAKKLPENTFLPRNAPIFVIRDGILERRLNNE